MHTYEHRKDDGVSPVIATILMVAITVVLVGVLYLWVISISTPENNPPPRVTWEVSDASGYTVNNTEGYDNVLLRVELTSKSFELSEITRWSYSAGDNTAIFMVVDNGSSCNSNWDAALADGSLFDSDAGWDNSSTCLRGDSDGKGQMNVLEYFYVLEQADIAPVGPNDEVTVNAIWNNDSPFLDETHQVRSV